MCGDTSIEQRLCELITKMANGCNGGVELTLIKQQLQSIQDWVNAFDYNTTIPNAAQILTTVPVASFPQGTSVQEILLFLNNRINTIHAPATLTNNAAPFQWNINTQTGNIPQAPSLTDEGGGEYTFSAGDGSADVTFLTGSGITDLSISNKTATTFDLNSSSGADVTVPAATSTEAGLFTAAEKLKLSGIATGAEQNVNADWNAVSGDALILNKPTIPSIAGLATVTYVNTQDSAKHPNIVFQEEGNPLGTSGTVNTVNFTGSAVTASRTGDAITVNVTGGGGGATNLTYVSSSTTGTVESDTGTDAIIPAATTSIAGLISAADKTKLNGIVSGANLYVHPNHSGDVVSVADGATTIQAGVVSNSKLANMGANTIKGSIAGGVPSDLTPTQVKSLLAITGTEVANTAAGNIASTTVQAAINELDGEKQVNVQFQEEGTNLGTSGTVNVINFTGATVTASRSGNTLTVDVAGGGGGGATNLSVTNRTSTTLDVASDTGTDATIPEASITEAGLLIATDKVKLNNTTGTNTGDQTSIVGITGTKAQFDTAVTDGNFLYVGDISQYTDELAQDAVGLMIDSTLVYVDGTPLLTRAALTGDVTASQASNATTIANNVVTNTKLAQAPANTLKGNNTGSTANEADLTASQVKTMLAIAASDVSNTPSGSIASTTVQTALNELDAEKHTNIQFQNEGTNLSTAGTVDVINFTGAAINAARVGNTVTVDVSATSGVTNLGYTASSTNGIVTSDTGTDATIPLVTGTDAGLLAPADFTKLGFITITQAVNLDTLESDTATNNAKVTNATHSGDATGSTVLTLATVNSNVGTFGSGTQIPQFVVNGKGLITSVSNVTITPTASSITGAGDVTKTDDTNVTLTLGGTPTGSVLNSVSFTLGWTGILSTTRGGTGLSVLGTANQQLRVNAGGTALEYFTPVSGGITSLNGLTAAAQTFTNDTNVSIVSGGTAHVITWNGTLADGRIASASNWNSAYTNRITSLTTTGNSGASTLISNVLNIPTYTLAGLGGISLTSLSSTATGLTYTDTTGVFSLTSGYVIPTTTQETNWNTAYTNRITSLTTTGSSGAATLVSNVLNIPNYTLAGLGGQPLDADLTAIAALTGTSGFLKTDGAGTWTVDTNTYLTGNQSITLSGEASGSGTTGISVTLSNSAVIGKVLTGFTSTTGTILATDSILQAIQKLDGNLAAATAGGVSSVTGTTNRITSTGGSNPIIDISSAYVGQSSITTLGTISTGVWQGTTVDELYGGTGINTYTTGDILYSSATNTLSKLPISTNGKVLTITAGIPSWETPTSGVTDHTALSNLVWTSSSHTGTASRIAGFNGSGVASYYQIGVDLQGYDATLNALASYNTNGILTQTGVDTFVGRSLEGTTNRITLTNGDGVLGNPTVDISNNYVGQSSITTLGTVTTGIWNGTAIGDSYISSASTWNSKQAAYTNLTSIGALANSAGVLTNDGSGVFSYTSITGYTTEEAQDAVGAMVDSTLVYDDATPLLTRASLTGAITASQGSNTTSLGSFTLAQLNTAISDADVATGGGTATGTNTGDNAVNTLYSGLVSNATHTGDATGATSLTVVGINGTLLSGLATGILKNTTGTGVPSIAVAGDFPTLNQNTTGSAATLTTGRTISITGDLSYTSPSFNGSGNVTAAGTLATVNANVGSFGSATQVGTFTVNGKGLITAASNVTITPAASSITGAGALTKVDDTNVTLTLGGTPSTALLAATSLTLGWTGTLADSRITSAATWNSKQAGIQFKDEGTNLGTTNTVTEINFTGAAVTASRSGNILTVDIPATSGVTNLAYTASSTNGIVTSDTGTDSTIPAADGTNAGLMVPSQFTKLSNISITQPVDLDALEADVADLTTLSGVASNATTLGTFTGATIPDSSTNKAALQSLETALEENYVVTNRQNKIRVVSANTTISATTDGTVVFDTAATVATLPSPTNELILRIKNVSAGNITMTGHLDGVASQTLTIPSFECRTLHGTNTTFYIVA